MRKCESRLALPGPGDRLPCCRVSAWVVTAVIAATAILAAGLVAACAGEKATHLGSTKLCTPGQEVFCLCKGGKENGTKTCSASGDEFGMCEPCTPLDAFVGEPELPTVEEDLGRSTEPDTARRAETVALDSPETCPGMAIDLATGTPQTIQGDTAKAKGDTAGEGNCKTSASSKDLVYAVTVAAKGKLTATLKPDAAFDGSVYVRTSACEANAGSVCAEVAGPGGSEVAVVPVTGGQTVWVVVDGKAGSAGKFSLTLLVSEGGSCGDGSIDSGEACDDSNTKPGDGCSAKCAPDGFPKEAGQCPGQIVHLWGAPFDIVASTNTFGNLYKGTCGGGSSREAVYALMPHKDGTLNATITTSDFDQVLFLRDTNCLTGNEIACASLAKGNVGEVLQTPVSRDKPLWLFVDGFKLTKGNFTVRLQLD
ncbi:MAG: hypothetical protein EXR79_15070 [Myxococcales bacterium]|nr:hypothetical protein [Myxococcales bacterium]